MVREAKVSWQGPCNRGRAIELLRQAAGKGHLDIDYLKAGTDLAPLRGRADFQKLRAEGDA